MRVIDLLNKIANGEEVPKKISFGGEIFEFRICCEKPYYYVEDNRCLGEIYAIDKILNDEVEIIEEDKTIDDFYLRNEKGEILIDANMFLIKNKINELVKEINKLKENKDESSK